MDMLGYKSTLDENMPENQLETLIRARQTGLSITWFVTWLCNYKCPYCWERIDEDLYRKSLIKTNNIAPKMWAEAFNGMHPKEIYFTGGEPTLYSKLPEVFGLLDKNIKLKITSNFGSSFTLERYSPYILEKRFSVVGLSFHPSEIELNSFLHKIDRALELGYNEACDLGIEMVLYPDDIEYAPQLIKYCSDNDVKLLLDTYDDPKGIYVMPEQLKQQVNKYKNQAEEINLICRDKKESYGSNMKISVNSIMQENKVVLYGAGNIGHKLEQIICGKGYKGILHFADSTKGGKGILIDGIEVLAPCEAISRFPDATYVITVQKKELIAEIAVLLYSMGVPKEKIKVYAHKSMAVGKEFKRGKQAIWCPAGMSVLHIDPNGDAYPCMRAMTNEKQNDESETAIRMKLGNVLEDPKFLVKLPIICKDSYRCSACDYQLLEHTMTNYE